MADIANHLSWSIWNGTDFGLGLVLCRGERVLRLWLPEKERTEAWAQLEICQAGYAEASLHGAATDVAPSLERAVLRGEDVTEIPVVFPGTPGTFLRRVWEECHRIPAGSVVEYGALAAAAGSPKACRAVGNAMATNPIPLIIPCHRVVRRGGNLGNYGGGVAMKRWLLEKESALLTA